MSNVLSFLIRLKTIRKGEAGLTPRKMREALLAEHLGPLMHSKLNLVYRDRRKRSACLP